MRHLKTFSLFESAQELTPQQQLILYDCTDGTRGAWSVNPSTGLVDVKGDFKGSGKDLRDFNFNGIRFGEVTGNFDCSRNSLQTLEGAPKTVGGYFDCSANSLTTLEGAPETVGGSFYCSYNPLQTLEGAPKIIRGEFFSGEIDIPEGEWTIPGLVKEYLQSSGEKKDLLGTLKTLISPEALQKAIDQNPEKMAVELKGILKDLMKTPEYQSLKFPARLQGEVDLLGDLSGVGL